MAKKKKYKDIFNAIEANDIETVKTFLPEQLEVINEAGWMPIHYACRYGHTEIARLLLDRGADIKARDNDGETPFHKTCMFGCIDTARLLLDRGADIEARDKEGYTPLHRACQYSRTETVFLLLDHGADIEAKDKYGWTPLHFSCINGHTKTSEFLVTRGADPLVKDNDGKTSLDKDSTMVKDKNGNEIPHRDILNKLRDAYLINKHALEAANTTAALSSGWEMEM